MTGTSTDERALVAAVLAQAPGAFERLVREYQGLCWHIIHRMVRHPDDASELCQEAFLRVHQCLHQFRHESPLKSWVGQVAYSVAKRHLERLRIPLAELSQAIERDEVVAAEFARSQAFDSKIGAALVDLPVPLGVLDRLLAQAAAAEWADAPAPAARIERNWPRLTRRQLLWGASLALGLVICLAVYRSWQPGPIVTEQQLSDKGRGNKQCQPSGSLGKSCENQNFLHRPDLRSPSATGPGCKVLGVCL